LISTDNENKITQLKNLRFCGGFFINIKRHLNMKILKTDNFVSERMKFRPVTNAELEQIQKDIKDKKEILFLVWPESHNTVSKIIKYIGSEHKACTQDDCCGFILNIDDIRKLAKSKIIHMGNRETSDYVFMVNPDTSEEDMKEMITSSPNFPYLYNVIRKPEYTRQIFSAIELEDEPYWK